MRLAALVPLLAAACGRLRFDPLGGGTDDGSTARANVVFATSTQMLGTFGGIAVADQACRDAATNVGLPGTFVAWLSTSTVDARDRLAGSRGWVRVDGAPVADTLDEALAGRIFNPISLDEAGSVVLDAAWTGTGPDGRVLAGETCSDWTAGGGGAVGTTQASTFTHGTTSTYSCLGFSLPVLCFEIGHDVAVTPTVSTGRIAFVSGPTALNGLSALDAQCTSEAGTAGLSGSFSAAVATTSATAASRFSLDATPWRRVDGTLVTTAGTDLFDGTDLRAFINQAADGTYLATTRIVVGAMMPTTTGTVATTCNNWGGTNGQPVIGDTGTVVNRYVWYEGNLPACTAPLPPVLCLQN